MEDSKFPMNNFNITIETKNATIHLIIDSFLVDTLDDWFLHSMDSNVTFINAKPPPFKSILIKNSIN